jgi:hypothetical protein
MGLAPMPLATGSPVFAITMGIVAVAYRAARLAAVRAAMITSNFQLR